ncbi:hypothetical protein KSP39_PZI005677 [Platanthera zijinensis]|uniref:Dehydrin n=1 Tax=Platanthera zijinensis TaxID=2320716 RepID=A0AAP0GB28_9ASPA
MNPRDQHIDRLAAANTTIPAYSVSTDQPQMTHPSAPVTQGNQHVVGLGTTGTLHRSGSSSSSSSEDDGAGGRRKKKSITEKIKEKMPGGHNKNDDYYGMNPAGVEHQEKKGIMGKIKEKLPGTHNK